MMGVNTVRQTLSSIARNSIRQAIKPRRLKYAYLKFASFLATHGIRPPLSASLIQMQAGWKNQGAHSEDRNPELYIKEDNSTPELFREVLPYLDKDSSILEIGCGPGRNLNYLYKLGYHNLTGIEIGPQAVELMKSSFREMYSNSTIHIGDAPMVLKRLATHQFDLVYCHSVLVNIHPKHNYVFAEMARVAKDFILTLENEGSYDAYPRDFKKLFEKHRWKMIVYKVYAGHCSHLAAPFEDQYVYKNNTLRLFVPDKCNLK